MKLRPHCALVLSLFSLPTITVADTARITPKQQQYLDSVIFTQLRNKEQREIVYQWPVAKQFNEFICKPAAMAELSGQKTGAEKIIFLTQSLTESPLPDTLDITGTAQYRTGLKWHEFQYLCRINPDGQSRQFVINPRD